MAQKRLNAYRVMWLFVMFDLPTNTKKERVAASDFRRRLKLDGFIMEQYSVYVRHCASRENAQVHVERVKSFLPEEGYVKILMITDKQYGNTMNFWGKAKSPPKKASQQLEMF